MNMFLTDDELEDATRYRQPAAQARFLERMRVPYRRRRDGTLLVGRAALERAMMSTGEPATSSLASDDAGLNWSTSA